MKKLIKVFKSKIIRQRIIFSLILILLISNNSLNAQWSGTNPVVTTSDCGIGTITPDNRLEIVREDIETSTPENTILLNIGKNQLMLTYKKSSNSSLALGSGQNSGPITLISDNSWDIFNESGLLRFKKFDNLTSSSNDVLDLDPITSQFYSSDVIMNNITVPGQSTLNQIYSTDINTTNITANNMVTTNFQNNGNMNVKGDFRVKNAAGVNVFKVDQNGNVRSREVKVDLAVIPDYVFKDDYKLMNLNDLEKFIAKENHLPNIKSAEEYSIEGGINLGELNIKLLEKVEELTLYILELKKDITKLQNK